MIDLSNENIFGKGGHRVCYIHPENPDRCLKLPIAGRITAGRTGSPWYKRWKPHKSFDHGLQEDKAYRESAIKKAGNDAWTHLARGYGFVDTTLGQAFEAELITSEGHIAPTVLQHLQTHGLSADIKRALKDFEAWLRRTQILTKNILLKNVVVKKDNGKTSIILIDGLGTYPLIPLAKFIPYFRKQHIERRIERMWDEVNKAVDASQ